MFRKNVTAAVLVAATLPVALGAQDMRDKLQIHGFLTQGFAASDSLPIVGITNRGSVDYRAAALQFRFAPTSKDAAVVQLANRRMGESVLNDVGNDVQVQWAYYQRRLGAGITAKLGRAPMARGIFNEVRKVGTVLPFYRAPYNFYTESFETLDGALLRHDAALGGGWALETSAFVGNFKWVQKSAQSIYAPRMEAVNGKPTMVGVDPVRDTTYLIDRRGDRGVGGQLWLSTPIEGLRVGAGGTRFSLNDLHELSGKAGRVGSTIVQAGVDGNFTRFQLRGEWEQQQSGEFLYTAHYAQGGVKLTQRLSLNVQREEAHVHYAGRPVILGVPAEKTPLAHRDSRLVRDVGVGATLSVRPDVVLKLEGHDNKGSNYDRTTVGPVTGRYVISSLAVSF